MKKQSERSSSPKILLTDQRLFILPFDLRDYQKSKDFTLWASGPQRGGAKPVDQGLCAHQGELLAKNKKQKKSVTLSEMAS